MPEWYILGRLVLNTFRSMFSNFWDKNENLVSGCYSYNLITAAVEFSYYKKPLFNHRYTFWRWLHKASRCVALEWSVLPLTDFQCSVCFPQFSACLSQMNHKMIQCQHVVLIRNKHGQMNVESEFEVLYIYHDFNF